MAAWTEHVMWWHLYPLGFVGAPVRPDAAGFRDAAGSPDAADAGRDVVHRLGRIEAWLDHVIELGLNGIALGPVFAASTHGYDTVDHFRIDPRLGDDADFDRLVDEAHRRGIRVMLDGVFNHVGRKHPAFRAVEAEGPAAPTAGLFRVRWDGWRPGDPVDADVFEGHGSLVALDHSSPAVEDLVVDVMNNWLERGADAWRLDAAYAVPPAFWARVLPRVRREHPDAWFSGEVIHGDAAAIVRESTLDSLTQYELWQGIWHGIADRNLFELQHALQRHDALTSTFVPSTFLGNHDVTRVASAIGAEFVPHALAVLLTVAGVPSIYAGDEYAFTGIKEERFGGDDAVRPEFPAQPPAPETLDAVAREVLEAHHALIALRRRMPWLHRTHTEVIDVDNASIVIRSVAGPGTAGDAEPVVTMLNLGATAVDLPTAGARSVAAGRAELRGDRVRLPAGGWAVLTA